MRRQTGRRLAWSNGCDLLLAVALRRLRGLFGRQLGGCFVARDLVGEGLLGGLLVGKSLGDGGFCILPALLDCSCLGLFDLLGLFCRCLGVLCRFGRRGRFLLLGLLSAFASDPGFLLFGLSRLVGSRGAGF